MNEELYKIKAVHDDIDEDGKDISIELCGYYLRDGLHDIDLIAVDDKEKEDFPWLLYEVNPYSICRNTGIKDKAEVDLYEYDIVSFKEAFSNKVRYGRIEQNAITKQYAILTNSECRQYRQIKDCYEIKATGKNAMLRDADEDWFTEYSKREYDKTIGTPIDNSYCPSKFKR